MKFNLLFISGMIVIMLNLIWFEQIRNSKLLKSRLRKKPMLSIYLFLTPVTIYLSINQAPFAILVLLTIALLSILFALSHSRFAFRHPGVLTWMMPVSFLHFIAGAMLFTATFTSLFLG
ncbi:MAG: hypothetical protein D6677_09905 [Calditrichaeota bacterium]|nr:MAG: hypothetical protein D6677_09905 [Calditrichota bacterium]